MFVKPRTRSNSRQRRMNPLGFLLGTCLIGVPLLALLLHEAKHGSTRLRDLPPAPDVPLNPLDLIQRGGPRLFLGGRVAANKNAPRRSRYAAAAYYYDDRATPGPSPVGSSNLDQSGYLYDGAVGDTKTGYTRTLKTGGGLTMNAIIDMGPGYASIPIKFLRATFKPKRGGYLSGSIYGSSWINLTPLFNITSNTQYQLFSTVSYRYYQFSQIDGGGPGTSATVTDFRLYDSTGAIVGPPANTHDDPEAPRSGAYPGPPAPLGRRVKSGRSKQRPLQARFGKGA